MRSPTELRHLLQRFRGLPAETEWLEFKEARQNFHFDDLGKYFSALSNEANLHGADAGWIVFGVADHGDIVGSQYRPQRPALDSLKHEIASQTGNRLTFIEIHELLEPEGRVILFEIPPAPRGLPVAWKGHFYGRDGESLVALNLWEIERIRHQGSTADWSVQPCAGATLEDLDRAAITQARAHFKQRLPDRVQAAEVDAWDDTAFLDRAKLTVSGQVIRAAILLLGRPESAALLTPATAQITWRLEGEERAYEHFEPPFLLTVNDVFRRIRNLRFRLQPFGQLIPVELEKYDAQVVLEALNNCLAHPTSRLRRCPLQATGSGIPPPVRLRLPAGCGAVADGQAVRRALRRPETQQDPKPARQHVPSRRLHRPGRAETEGDLAPGWPGRRPPVKNSRTKMNTRNRSGIFVCPVTVAANPRFIKGLVINTSSSRPPPFVPKYFCFGLSAASPTPRAPLP